MNKVTIADGSNMLSSNLTKQDGEKKKIGPAVVGVDKQQKVIEVPVIKGTSATNHEEIVKHYDEVAEKKISAPNGGNIEHNQQSPMNKALTI